MSAYRRSAERVAPEPASSLTLQYENALKMAELQARLDEQKRWEHFFSLGLKCVAAAQIVDTCGGIVARAVAIADEAMRVADKRAEEKRK